MAGDSFKAALIGPGFYGKLKETIAKVDGTPVGSGATKIPTDLGGDGGGFVPKTFRIATFTGAWSVNSDKTVTLASDTARTLTATNLFYDLKNTSFTTCGIAKDGTAWYLVAPAPTVATASVTVITGVSLGSAGLQFTRAVVTVVATATASSTNIGTTACT